MHTLTQRPRRVLAALMAGALGLSLATAPVTPASAEPTQSGLIAWYPLQDSAGTTIADASGNNRDATVVGGGQPAGDAGMQFTGSNHVLLPDNLISGLDAVTVTAEVLVDPTQTGDHFLYNFGNPAVGSPQSGNGYLFQTDGNGAGNTAYRGVISDLAWGREQALSRAGSLPKGVWQSVALTISGSTGLMYLNGSQVASNTGLTIKPRDIGDGADGTTSANFLGKSAYTSDNLFKGRMRDFRLYDRALTAAEIGEIDTANSTISLVADRDALTLGDTTRVEANLTLPSKAPYGSAVTWQSANPALVSATGVITVPAESPQTTTLTATLTGRGGSSITKAFAVTVLPSLTAQQRAQAAVDTVSVHNIDDVRGNLTLPVIAGAEDATVTWGSSDAATISATGEVHRPATGSAARNVTLTASLTIDGATATRIFAAAVPALPATPDLEGYLFSYFVGEGTATGEQVYFGLSKGNDPLHYQNLNDNQPVLTSSLGEKGLRDPFIIRSPEGDKFYQIATDLKINGNGNWDASQRTGSTSIMVWESTDLVNWTDQRLVKVSPDTAGNTWAPEAYWDDSLGSYVVFWASKLYPESDPHHTGSSYNRMMYSTTRDFQTFTPAQIWIDPGYSVIDSTVAFHDGQYYRFTKDERSNTNASECGKFITAQKDSDLRSTDYDFVADCIGKGNIAQGEGPTIFKDNEAERWYMFIDEFGGRGYVPFTTTDLDGKSDAWSVPADYAMPARPRHGTVLPVTQAEYDRLLATYQPDALVTSITEVSVTVQTGRAPVLPAEVTVTHADDSTSREAVVWDAVPAGLYAQAGTFTVSGAVSAAPGKKATAKVTVTDEAVAVGSITVSQSAVTLKTGATRAIQVTLDPPNASDASLAWTSGDRSIARVDADGTIRGVKAGTTTVTVSAKGAGGAVVSQSIAVTVVEDVTAGLVLRYEFEGAGATAQDISGTGNDGTIVNGAPRTVGVNGDALALSRTTKNHVTLPEGLLDTDALTVSTWVNWTSVEGQDPWTWTLGSNQEKYLFQAPSHWSGGTAVGITLDTWRGENQVTRTGDLAADTWVLVTTTLGDGVLTYYVNGASVGSVETAITPRQLDAANDMMSGYIGRSMYSADPYFTGAVDDFRFYDRALTADEVLALADESGVVVEPEPSASPSPSPSPSPSVSPSASPSVSPSPTATAAPTGTVSPTVTRTVTAPPTSAPGDVYSQPGFHLVNGRSWYTTCEPYSQTVRCRTEIWSTQVESVGGTFVSQTGWHFNNLTYLPRMTRAQWGTNPLATKGEFTSSGRKWKTECDTAVTGRNGCRSFIWMTGVVESKAKPGGGYSYRLVDTWVFNNIVRFR